MSDAIEIEIYIDDEFCAGVSGPRKDAAIEALRYIPAEPADTDAMICVYEVSRKFVTIDELMAMRDAE